MTRKVLLLIITVSVFVFNFGSRVLDLLTYKVEQHEQSLDSLQSLLQKKKSAISLKQLQVAQLDKDPSERFLAIKNQADLKNIQLLSIGSRSDDISSSSNVVSEYGGSKSNSYSLSYKSSYFESLKMIDIVENSDGMRKLKRFTLQSSHPGLITTLEFHDD